MNGELADKIAQPDADIRHFADIALKDKQLRSDIVELTLHHPHIMVYYHGYYILDKATEANPGLFYKHWEDFAKLLKHKNTYHRQTGIVLVSNLCRADKENKFHGTIGDYLDCLYDKKILIGIYSARYLKAIIKNKPEYRERIITELLHHRERTAYSEKQEALLEYETLEIFDQIYYEWKNKAAIGEFITERQKSISPKTRKKSKELLGKLGIP